MVKWMCVCVCIHGDVVRTFWLLVVVCNKFFVLLCRPIEEEKEEDEKGKMGIKRERVREVEEAKSSLNLNKTRRRELQESLEIFTATLPF